MSKKVADPWQAECDARTLTEHAAIVGNKARMTAAAKVLKKQQAEIGQALKPKTVTRPKAKAKAKKTFM